MKKTLSVIALTLLAACASSTGGGEETDGLLVRTDQRVYPLPAGGNYQVMVSFSVQNTASVPVSVPRCGTVPLVEVQHRENGKWVTVNSGFCAANVVMGPAQLAPGESLTGTLNLGRMGGMYRIRVPLVDTSATNAVTRHALSPEFEVRWTDG